MKRRHAEVLIHPEIERLERQLSEARYAIVTLGTTLAMEYEKGLPPETPADPKRVVSFPGAAPPPPAPAEEPLDRFLGGYHSCQSRSELGQWRRAVVDRIVDLASRAAPAVVNQWPRADCPFCRLPGWAIPEGLRRHLSGHGNIVQCLVTVALWKQSADSLEDAFAQADRAAAADQVARRRSERMFLIDPERAPVLLNEGLWGVLREAPRNTEQLTAAEDRLRELGFAPEADGSVIAWKYRQEPYAVLADPRVAGRVRFCVYDEARLAAARDKRRRRRTDWNDVVAGFRAGPLTAAFYLRDNWRNDIVGKFRTRLREAIATIDRDGAASDRRNE